MCTIVILRKRIFFFKKHQSQFRKENFSHGIYKIGNTNYDLTETP